MYLYINIQRMPIFKWNKNINQKISKIFKF